MPAFAPEPRLRSRPSGWIVDEGGCVLLLAGPVVAAEVVGEDTEGKNVEVEAKEAEDEANEVEVEDSKELENLLSWSSGGA